MRKNLCESRARESRRKRIGGELLAKWGRRKTGVGGVFLGKKKNQGGIGVGTTAAADRTFLINKRKGHRYKQ